MALGAALGSTIQSHLDGKSRNRRLKNLKSIWTVTAFYKRESQEKQLPLRLEEAGMFAFSPAHVMLGGSGFFFLQIHLVIVTTLSASDANKQCGC
jgi:hypothetical protein